MATVVEKFQAVTSQGSALFRGTKQVDGSVLWQKVDGLKSIDGPNTTKAEIDVTHLGSSKKEKIYGMPDDGDLSGDMLLNLNWAVHRAMVSIDAVAPYNIPWKLVLSDGNTYYFDGNVKSMPMKAGVDQANTANLTIGISASKWDFSSYDAEMSWTDTLTGDAATGVVTGSILGLLEPNPALAVAEFTDSIATGATFTKDIHYKITNTPVGLVPKLTKKAVDEVELTYTGTSVSVTPASNIRLEFLPTMFANNLDPVVINGIPRENIEILFS